MLYTWQGKTIAAFVLWCYRTQVQWVKN